MTDSTRQGFVYGLVAYGWWGLVPLYFRWLRHDVTPGDMLAHRVVWSALLLAAVLSLAGRWAAVGRSFADRRRLGPLALSAVLIAANWLVYIWCVHTDQVVQASLGYFITPLASVLLGLVVFRERLRGLQWAAVGLAALGVGLLTAAAGVMPWLALSLAATFSTYGLIRKQVPVDGLTGLAVETFLLLPVALAYLGAGGGPAALADAGLAAKLVFSGVVTAVPLLCFGQAARRLPLSTLGFLQYVSPTIQFVLAVGLLGEPLQLHQLPGFALVWAALALFTADSVAAHRPRPAAEPA